MRYMDLLEFAQCVQPLPKAKRPAQVPEARKVTGIVTDMDYYAGDTTRDQYRTLLGKRAATRADVVARYNTLRGRVVQREVARTSADKLLGVFAKRGRVVLLVALVEVHTHVCVVWHDVTVTGDVMPGDVLTSSTTKLPQREIDARIPTNDLNVSVYVQRLK